MAASSQKRNNDPRINNQIRKSPVRLIDEDGTQLGIVPVEEARDRARDKGLDLVEVGPNADPPVCRILDWGKLRYEKQKKEREAKKKTQTIEVKEVKYRPTIDEHDRDRKTDRARKFLEQGNKVKVTVFFRYRQLRRPQLGQEILDHVQNQLADVSSVEHRTRGLEGRQMIMILAPVSPKKEKEKEKKEAAS
ncbi:MAG TPA: translation initiation factor IF-3 [Thermoanaerobaculia bacterium]|nr:translation initiation factor IF-3 [Thermoanaerobaculia bacterium]